MTSETVQQTEVVWRIEFFGGVCLSRQGQRRPPFKTRRMTRLLARLACFPDRAHARDILAEELWPEEDPEAIRERFRQTLALLRRELEPENVAAGSVLIADRSTVRLAPDSFTTDIADFAASLRVASEETDPARQIAPLRQAVALYQGDLRPGFDEDWIQIERLHLAERHRQALVRLTEALTATGQLSEAIETARRTIAAAPLYEEAHCTLIRLFAQTGRIADAHRQYETLERLL
ncbi:MAG: transcriptional activator [Chthonomonadaceae bacterium]|nr:transcriptional activator [Chthonomonadaceae bacterium]